MISVGLLGTNTSHAGVFAALLNGGPDGAPARVAGARVTAVWSSGQAGLSGMHDDAPTLAARHGIDRVVEQPEDLLDPASSVDAVLVVDDLDGGSLHAELARPFVEAGVPTFIDKPMTLELADAASLFDVAERAGTPLLSSSALRFATELPAVTGPEAGVGALSSVVSVGPGDWYNYGVHAVEVACAVTGPGASWVQRFAGADRDVAVVGFDGGPTLVVQTLRDAAYLFHLSAYGSDGMAQTQIADADGFYAGTMAAFVRMVETGQSPVSPAETLQVLAILAAGERSAATGERVALAELLAAS